MASDLSGDRAWNLGITPSTGARIRASSSSGLLIRLSMPSLISARHMPKTRPTTPAMMRVRTTLGEDGLEGGTAVPIRSPPETSSWVLWNCAS